MHECVLLLIIGTNTITININIIRQGTRDKGGGATSSMYSVCMYVCMYLWSSVAPVAQRYLVTL